MVKEAGPDDVSVSLKRLHLFTHPSLLYGVIDKTRPARFLQRNLSYALSKKHVVQATGSELRVRLDGVAVTGKGVPQQVTLLVVLAEAASTGRDFKPVRAAAVALDTGVAQPGTDSDVGGPGAQQETGGAGKGSTPRTVCLPLPKRPLTRPVLLLLASDHHPQLQGLQPEPAAPRLMNTDLRPTSRRNGKLLGLLSDPCIAWAALQPLDGVLGAGGSSGAAEGAATAAAAETAGSGSADEDEDEEGGGEAGEGGRKRRRQGAGAVGALQLQRCRLTRSTCSVSGGAGRTLTTHLLNIDRGLEAAGQQAEDRTRATRNARSSKDGGAAAAPALPPPADGQAAVLESFAVSVQELRTAVRPPAAAAAAGGAAAATAAAAQDSPEADEGSVVEFRYVFDDASWAAAAAAAEAGLADSDPAPTAGGAARGMGAAAAAAVAANAAGSGAASAGGASARADWMQQQLANVAAKEAAAKEAAAQAAQEAAATDAEQHLGRKKGGRGPAAKQGKEPKPGAAGAAAFAFKERFFSEEVVVGPGGACRCLMCPVVCAGFQGLAVHLPASHGLYRYTCTRAAPQPAGKAEGGGSSKRGGGAAKGPSNGSDGGAGSAAPAKERRHVVEVRLPAETVDFARRDLKAPLEDAIVLATPPPPSPGQDQPPAVAPAAQRVSWRYVRRAGMRSPVPMRGILSRQVAARLGIPDSRSGSDSEDGSDSQHSDEDVVILEEEEVAAGKKARGKEKPGRKGAAAAKQQDSAQAQAQAQQSEPRGRQAARKVAGPSAAAGAKAGAAASEEDGATAATELVQVTVEALRRTIAGDALKAAAASGGADAADAAVVGAAAAAEPQLQLQQRRSGGGAAGAAAAAAKHPSAQVLPPSALAPGIHPPGRRYFHCRSAVPGSAAEMFGPYDSDDDTDDEEWEAAFDRHMTTSTTRMHTPLSDSERDFFKLWSAFARRRPLYADFITRKRCLQFAREHGRQLRADPGLRAALAVHLLLLREMNLVDPRLMARCLQVADGSIAPTPEEDERFLAMRISGPGSRAAAAAAAAATSSGGGAAAPGGGDLEDDDDRHPPGAGNGAGARRGGGGGGPGGGGGGAGPDAGSGSGDDDDDGGEGTADGDDEDEDAEDDAMEDAEAVAEATRGHKRSDSHRSAAPRGQQPGPRQRRGGGGGAQHSSGRSGASGDSAPPEGQGRKALAAVARGAAAAAAAAAAAPAGVAAAAVDGASVEAESPASMEGVEGPARRGSRDGGAKKEQPQPSKKPQAQQQQQSLAEEVAAGPAALAWSQGKRTKSVAAAPPLPPRPQGLHGLQGRHAAIPAAGKVGAAAAEGSGVAAATAAGGKENAGAAGAGRR
ncbi:hypothetical protein HXX76_008323 [Chlamydomonas incerta]|uniref:Polycomb protein VEFS-Box domain-containing protein n=1 Tax=Chlamydomonas incerta TaxID=51695 RepID=A0A835VZ42_CHLIN|nr:hypothetical protein HXX76_008323 [Chlamydomonas incerta]|eukprot:KAG2433255.1 hypothetical protein HXX76_008323 [Chlamydomonas incerta]